MKKKLIASLAVVAIFILAIAAYAYTQNNTTIRPTASCCKSKDSCPMKSKGHDGSGEHAKMSCCKKHDGEHAEAEGSCCDCCGDSCPMKKKDGAATISVSTAEEGKDCCDNCDCCKGRANTSI